jgi:PAS domain S-box-containing protein
LFKQVPVVFAGIAQSHREELRLNTRTTGMFVDIDYTGLLETALKIHPQTRHVIVVNGSSRSDQHIEKQIRTSLAPYTEQYAFTYLTGLPMEEIQQKVQNLPKDSVVLYFVITQDGAGRGFQPAEAAKIVAEAANAPVYGCLDTYLGSGIVGGRMVSLEMTGIKAGEMASRILQGENPANIPITSQGTIVDLFDWRQFKRFGISEDRLPPGSTLRFKEYTFWELYRNHVLWGLCLIVVQSALIAFLLHQRVRIRRAQVQLKERLCFEELLASLSARFVNLPPNNVHEEIKQVLESISTVLKVDRVSVFELSERDKRLYLIHSFTNEGIAAPPVNIHFEQIPWISDTLLQGEVLALPSIESLPAEAETDTHFLRELNTSALALIPLSIGNKTSGVLSLSMVRERRNWPVELIKQCRMIAEIFANALARKEHEETLMTAEQKFRTVADFNYDWEFWMNTDGSIEYVSPSCERITGYTPQEFVIAPSIIEDMIVPEDRAAWNRHRQDVDKMPSQQEVQFRIRTKDGEVRWIEHVCQQVTDPSGEPGGIRVSNRDITARKRAEFRLREAYVNIEKLKNQLEAETTYLKEEIRLDHNFDNIIGNSAELKYVLYKVEQVSPGDTTVLILGESGTGKELIARAIHNRSPRGVRPLIKVNCAALPSLLIESELFGHEKGAFTGAHSRQLGRFEIADGTSVFLDEIGELPIELQVKLLRVLQDGEFERLGSTETKKVDVRVIAATNRDLEEEVLKGSFRKDLFYRLNVFPITVPPLRQRRDDIPLLTRFIVENAAKRHNRKISHIPKSVVQKLQDYQWPGNVRELINVLERAVINSSGTRLQLADNLIEKRIDNELMTVKSLQEIERNHILKVMEITNWRVAGDKGAAVLLEMNPSTLRSRMKKLNINTP